MRKQDQEYVHWYRAIPEGEVRCCDDYGCDNDAMWEEPRHDWCGYHVRLHCDVAVAPDGRVRHSDCYDCDAHTEFVPVMETLPVSVFKNDMCEGCGWPISTESYHYGAAIYDNLMAGWWHRRNVPSIYRPTEGPVAFRLIDESVKLECMAAGCHLDAMWRQRIDDTDPKSAEYVWCEHHAVQNCHVLRDHHGRVMHRACHIDSDWSVYGCTPLMDYSRVYRDRFCFRCNSLIGG